MKKIPDNCWMHVNFLFFSFRMTWLLFRMPSEKASSFTSMLIILLPSLYYFCCKYTQMLNDGSSSDALYEDFLSLTHIQTHIDYCSNFSSSYTFLDSMFRSCWAKGRNFLIEIIVFVVNILQSIIVFSFYAIHCIFFKMQSRGKILWVFFIFCYCCVHTMRVESFLYFPDSSFLHKAQKKDLKSGTQWKL